MLFLSWSQYMIMKWQRNKIKIIMLFRKKKSVSLLSCRLLYIIIYAAERKNQFWHFIHRIHTNDSYFFTNQHSSQINPLLWDKFLQEIPNRWNTIFFTASIDYCIILVYRLKFLLIEWCQKLLINKLMWMNIFYW